jgi:hypothetical protein
MSIYDEIEPDPPLNPQQENIIRGLSPDERELA